MNPSKNKRQVDFHAIAEWVGKGERARLRLPVEVSCLSI